MELAVIPDGRGLPKLALTCTVDYDDGTRKQCKCNLGANDCTEGIEFPRRAAVIANMSGLPEIGAQLPNGQFLFYNEGARIAFVGSTRALVVAAANEKENFAFFRSDDTFISSVTRVREIHQPSEGFVFGAINAPFPPVSGNVQFVLTMGSQRVAVKALIPFETMGAAVFEKLMSPAPRLATREIPLSKSAELLVNDPSLGYYLSPFNTTLHESYGNFGAFLEEIITIEHPGPLRIGAIGIRDEAYPVVSGLSRCSSSVRTADLRGLSRWMMSQ